MCTEALKHGCTADSVMAVLPERKMSDAWLASVISNTASDAYNHQP